jgi:hypothetical protein
VKHVGLGLVEHDAEVIEGINRLTGRDVAARLIGPSSRTEIVRNGAGIRHIAPADTDDGRTQVL